MLRCNKHIHQEFWLAAIQFTDPPIILRATYLFPCRRTHTHTMMSASKAVLGLYKYCHPEKVDCAKGERLCMCMDAHVPSYWDICELAATAKLAIKLCHGRCPLEECNVYHWALAWTFSHWNPEFLANALL